MNSQYSFHPSRGANPRDWSHFINDSLVTPIAQGYKQAVTNLFDAAGSYGRSRISGSQLSLEACCSCDTQDSCHCACCVMSADVVLYSKLGERRIVQLSLSNSWRRDRKIHLDLSPFSRSGGGDSPVSARLVSPGADFTLPPCGTAAVVLEISSDLPAANREVVLQDVDNCAVSYADLRVVGCDIRPVRIAVALLPRDCGEKAITCGCECC